jgi:hypothetical protein
METIVDILKYLLPSVITFITAFFILKRFLETEERKSLLELKQLKQNEIFKIKLQAYERTLLFLERISPYSLIPRVHKNGMSAIFLQTELLHSIRSEFEHNLTMQLYMSAGAWELVKNAKEETVKIINLAATKLTEHSSGADLARNIYDITTQLNRLPNQIAIDYLKKEFQAKFE